MALAHISRYDAEAVYRLARSAAIPVFCDEVKGKRDLALSRDLGLPHKSAFVLLHKRREAMQRK